MSEGILLFSLFHTPTHCFIFIMLETDEQSTLGDLKYVTVCKNSVGISSEFH